MLVAKLENHIKMNKLAFFFTVLSFVFCLESVAQEDSLRAIVNNSSGEPKVKALTEFFKLHLHSDPSKAMDFAKEALLEASTTGYDKGVASAYNNIGVVYKNQGVYDKAIEYYLKSLEINERLNNLEGIAFTKGNIGTVYSQKEDYPASLDYFLQSHQILDSINDYGQLAASFNNLGNVYHELNKMDRALECFNSALELIDSLGYQGTSVDPLYNLGNIYFKLNNFEKALSCYQKSLDSEIANKSISGQAYSMYNIGHTYLKLGDVEKALLFQEQALNLAIKVGAFPIMKEIYHSLSEIHYSKSDFKQAYEFRLLYDDVRDQVYSEESSRKLAQLELGYVIEQKEKENLVLKQNQEIKDLQIKNSRSIIIIFIMSVFIVLAVGGIFLKMRMSSNR